MTPPRLHAHLKTLREVEPHTLIFENKNALAPELCEQAVRRFEACKDEHYQGRIGQVGKTDIAVKRSTDLFISGKPRWKDIDDALFRSLAVAMEEFREAFPYFKGRFKDMGYGIQRTRCGEYYHWHVDGGSHDFSARQLVAIWYLNNVNGDGGETEFFAQNVRIRPEQGKLLLFPPFWTHEHRGVRLESGVKYIATTWIVFA